MDRQAANAFRAMTRVKEEFNFLGYVVADCSLQGDRDCKDGVLGGYDCYRETSIKLTVLLSESTLPALERGLPLKYVKFCRMLTALS